jgi:polysaccharide chain length determinant protein (PEP-CTERM system associated)
VIPGKQYSPDEVLATVWSRKWVVLLACLCGSLGAYGVSKLVPDRYRSDAVILVVPQRISQEYVRGIVTRVEDRLKTVSQEILGHAALQRLIEDFDLYQAERRTRRMEDVIALARRDIVVEPAKGDTFRVAYMSHDAVLAKRVTDRLANDFIEQNLRQGREVTERTSAFLDTQLDEARKRLVEKEQRLEEFKRLHAGELPTQIEANQQALANLQMQVQALVDSMSRDRDRRLQLERELADLTTDSVRSQAPVAERAPLSAPTRGTDEEALERAHEHLRDLQTRYKAEHPDVIRALRDVRDLEAKVAGVRAVDADGPRPAPAVNPAERIRQNRLRQLRGELENVDRQIAAKQADERRLRGTMDGVQRRLDATPTRETELVALTRDYTTLQQIYITLLAKKEDSKIAANLERRQVGEQFRIIDPARVPERPYTPNRQTFALYGGVGGMLLAVALIVLFEYRNASFRTEDEVLASIGLPVVAVIPVLTTVAEPLRSERLRRFLPPWAAATAALVLTMVAAYLGWNGIR